MTDKTIQFRLSGAPYLAELLKQQAQAYQREGHRHSPSKMARDLAEAAARYMTTGAFVPPASLRDLKTPPPPTAAAVTPQVVTEATLQKGPAAPRAHRAEARRFLK